MNSAGKMASSYLQEKKRKIEPHPLKSLYRGHSLPFGQHIKTRISSGTKFARSSGFPGLSQIQAGFKFGDEAWFRSAKDRFATQNPQRSECLYQNVSDRWSIPRLSERVPFTACLQKLEAYTWPLALQGKAWHLREQRNLMLVGTSHFE